jgi:hypothetical protein
MSYKKDTSYDELRKNRELENINKVLYNIDNNISLDKKINNKYVCNVKELKRVCELLDKTLLQIIEKCNDDTDFKLLFANNIKINPSRQGILDEKNIFIELNNEINKYDIKIVKLEQNEKIPIGDGLIKSRDDLIIDKIQKHKSFDGQIISKNMNGYIIHKCCYGNGGHQDNVFIEAITILPWIEKRLKIYKNEIYIFLFETNNKKIISLKENINNNKKICKSTFVFNKNQFIEYCKNISKINSDDKSCKNIEV